MRILFVHNGLTRFVELDLCILRQHYEVTECHLRSRRVNPALLWRQVAQHDVIFGWFASWHTFLPMLYARILHKPSVLVIGGYDVAQLPDIDYGHQRGGAKRQISRWTMWLSSRLVTNSQYSKAEAAYNIGISKERLYVVYHGLPDPFETAPAGRRERMALTVGNVDRCNLQRKGIEPFVQAAALLPDVAFVVIGAWKDDAIDRLRAIATSNVTFLGRVADESLLEHYRRASVYVQASRHEGFGLSVAEAMLAGCIPVVTAEAALPEVAGDCGFYCSSQEPQSIARAIQQALEAAEDARHRARERILSCFPLENRGRSFEQMLSNLRN